jgi:hypothetical protein
MTTIETPTGSVLLRNEGNLSVSRPLERRLRVVHRVSRANAVEAARAQLRRRNEETP